MAKATTQRRPPTPFDIWFNENKNSDELRHSYNSSSSCLMKFLDSPAKT